MFGSEDLRRLDRAQGVDAKFSFPAQCRSDDDRKSYVYINSVSPRVREWACVVRVVIVDAIYYNPAEVNTVYSIHTLRDIYNTPLPSYHTPPSGLSYTSSSNISYTAPSYLSYTSVRPAMHHPSSTEHLLTTTPTTLVPAKDQNVSSPHPTSQPETQLL